MVGMYRCMSSVASVYPRPKFGFQWFVVFFSRKVQTNQTNKHNKSNKHNKQNKHDKQDRQDKTRRHWAALGLKTPRSARIAQPTPRNPCRGGALG